MVLSLLYREHETAGLVTLFRVLQLGAVIFESEALRSAPQRDCSARKGHEDGPNLDGMTLSNIKIAELFLYGHLKH